jgi:hypothetical protein
MDNCPNGDYTASYYDKQCDTSPEKKISQNTPEEIIQ